VNGILRQLYELSKQLQDLHIDVGSTFQITTFIESITTREEKAELPLQYEKASRTVM
jgi:hypothetical protein